MLLPTLIIGGGQSAGAADFAPWRDRAFVIAINESWRLAPWADVLYGCDRAFWERRGPDRAPDQVRGAFAGRRVMAADGGPRPDLVDQFVQVVGQRGEVLTRHLGVLGDGGEDGFGGNGGFQCLNLAVQLGAWRRSSSGGAAGALAQTIIGVGLDFTGGHWHEHGGDANDPAGKAAQLARWGRAFDAQAPRLAELGVRYIDASPGGALTAFEKLALPAALAAVTTPSSSEPQGER